LDDILGKFEVDAKAGVECRRHPRFECTKTVEVIIYPVQEGRRPSRCFLLTQDISRGGFNLIYAVELFPGQRLEVMFDDRPARQAVVAWCKRLPNKQYSIGCKFETAEDARVPESCEA
jgi:hypothetical protein